MQVHETIAGFADQLDRARATGRTVGLVPTMGALHDGHRSLIERAAAECDVVAVTIFVNPLQFGDPADIEHYPRPLSADLARCEAAGVGAVLAPSVTEMYPAWPAPQATTVSVGALTGPWEGAARPGHFDGVATVVSKLLAIAGRCRAYFGEKDFQQLAVVRTLVADLSLPVTVVGCPTVREADGLALSSRNVRLSAAERSAAVVLSRALAAGRSAVAAGQRDPGSVAALMARVVGAQPTVELDYAAAVDARTLEVPARLDGSVPVRLLVAARVGPVRLIDNCEAVPPAVPGAGRAGDAAPRRAGVGAAT